MKKFLDFVPPTKVAYLERGPTLPSPPASPSLTNADGSGTDWVFDKEEVRIGSMDDNDVVLHDDTVSRYHCKIVQDDTGYMLVDLRSTNGTFINKVRIREAFLKPGVGGRRRPASAQVQRARRRSADRAVARRSLRAVDRRQREDARDLLDHREDRADRDDGGHRRRDRHRQGSRRAIDPRPVAAAKGRARGVRLRRGAAEPDRERAVRPREGQLHGRGDDARGSVRAGRRRHAVPRRAWRAAVRSPAQAAARARAARGPARRRREVAEGRRPHHRGDQPQPRGRSSRRAVSPRLVLSVERGALDHAVAARSRR